MFRIRRFNVLKTSTVVAVMYMLIVAIFAIPLLLIVAVAGVAVDGGPTQGALVVGVLVGALALVLIYGFIGWVFTAIACAIYNVAAGWVGGIEVQVEAVAPPAPPPAWRAPGSAPPASPAPPTPPSATPTV